MNDKSKSWRGENSNKATMGYRGVQKTSDEVRVGMGFREGGVQGLGKEKTADEKRIPVDGYRKERGLEMRTRGRGQPKPTAYVGGQRTKSRRGEEKRSPRDGDSWKTWGGAMASAICGTIDPSEMQRIHPILDAKLIEDGDQDQNGCSQKYFERP